jgi:hypothetical protein
MPVSKADVGTPRLAGGQTHNQCSSPTLGGNSSIDPAGRLQGAREVPNRNKRVARSSYYEKHDMPVDKAVLKWIEINIALAIEPYSRKGPLPVGWQQGEEPLLSALISQVRGQADLACHCEIHKGAIVDVRSGLTVMVFFNPNDKKYIMSIGGTTSGKAATKNIPFRLLANGLTIGYQWITNVSAVVCRTPPTSYRQAAAFAAELQRLLEEKPEYRGRGYTLHLTGHSKGANEAIYASLRQPTPLQTIAISPPHLSANVIATISPQNLECAAEFIHSYSPYGDPVPGLREIFSRAPGLRTMLMFSIPGVGRGHHFFGKSRASGLNKHIYPDRHFSFYLESVSFQATGDGLDRQARQSPQASKGAKMRKFAWAQR